MKRLTTVLGLALAGVLALGLLAGCEKKDDVIKVGVAGPITGPYAKFGEQLTRGAEAAAAAINEAGGINGRNVQIVPGDDACDAKQARAVANQLVNDGVVAVAGHFCSSSTIPASEVYNEANVLMITPASTNPQVTDRGLSNVFRVCGRDDQQGDVAGDYISPRCSRPSAWRSSTTRTPTARASPMPPRRASTASTASTRCSTRASPAATRTSTPSSPR